MKNTTSRISDATISFLGRTGILGLPIPSPTTLLVSLILGPALLMALHTVQVPAVFAGTDTPNACELHHEIDWDRPALGEIAHAGSGTTTGQVGTTDDRDADPGGGVATGSCVTLLCLSPP